MLGEVQVWGGLIRLPKNAAVALDIYTVVNPVQSLNTKLPILVTEDGIVIDVNPVQPKNALLPIVVTEDGIVIDVNAAQL